MGDIGTRTASYTEVRYHTTMKTTGLLYCSESGDVIPTQRTNHGSWSERRLLVLRRFQGTGHQKRIIYKSTSPRYTLILVGIYSVLYATPGTCWSWAGIAVLNSELGALQTSLTCSSIEQSTVALFIYILRIYIHVLLCGPVVVVVCLHCIHPNYIMYSSLYCLRDCFTLYCTWVDHLP